MGSTHELALSVQRALSEFLKKTFEDRLNPNKITMLWVLHDNFVNESNRTAELQLCFSKNQTSNTQLNWCVKLKFQFNHEKIIVSDSVKCVYRDMKEGDSAPLEKITNENSLQKFGFTTPAVDQETFLRKLTDILQPVISRHITYLMRHNLSTHDELVWTAIGKLTELIYAAQK